MNKFIDFMEKKVMPIANKIGQNIIIRAISAGMVSLVGIIIVASLATLVQNLEIEAYQNFINNTQAGQVIWNVCQNIWWGCLAMYGLLVCGTVGQSLWGLYGHKGLEGIGVSLASYIILIPWMTSVPAGENTIPAFGLIKYTNFSAESLLSCILVAIISVSILNGFTKLKALKVKMPEVVPAAVSDSFSKLFPVILTVIIFSTVAYLISNTFGGQSFNELINKFISTPLQGLTGNIGSAILIPLILSLLWFFGIHGNSIMGPIVSVALAQGGIENIELFKQGVTEWSQYNIFTNQFLYSFVYMGGASCTIGLIVAMFITNRRRHKVLLALGGPTCLFNINEPIIFGFPIVLNPMLFIPFVLGPAVISGLSYLAIDFGLVHPVVTNVPWTTPPIINGFLATGMHWTGAALSIVNIAIVVLMYIPFLKLIERQEEKELLELQNRETNLDTKAI